jgi:single-stranded-DNA-specific exonuclease
MRPVFVTYQVEVVGTPHIVGSNHLKFKVRRGDRVFDCIAFGLGQFLHKMHSRPTYVDIVYVLEFNHWNGTDKIQLRIKDIRLSG